MRRTRATPEMVGRFERACQRAADEIELVTVIGEEIRHLVPHDGSMVFGVDPGTLLAVAPCRIEAIDTGYCAGFWHGEFHDQDAAQFRDLSRAAVPATALGLETDGRPVRSARYRTFMQPQGYGDELRMVCRTGTSTWAMAGFYREAGRPGFDEDDVEVAAALSEVAGRALRTHVTAALPQPAPLTVSPGVMNFDRRGVLVSANAEATRWLATIYGDAPAGADWTTILGDVTTDDLRIPFPVIPLLLRARAVADGHEPGPARSRIKDRSGRWLVLHASWVTPASGGEGGVTVVVEPARRAEVAPMIVEAYGLSPRERDVLQWLTRGCSNAEIAAALHVSVHTVRDYVKSVFAKVGVSGRGELVAVLFGEHYSDSVHAASVHA